MCCPLSRFPFATGCSNIPYDVMSSEICDGRALGRRKRASGPCVSYKAFPARSPRSSRLLLLHPLYALSHDSRRSLQAEHDEGTLQSPHLLDISSF